MPVAAVRFQRSIVIPVEPAPKVCTIKPVKALVAPVRETRRAQAAMDAERSASLVEIAARFQRQPDIFARILRINYLAPDIIAALLDSTQPPHLTRKKLVDANLPMDWAMQRRLFGFAERPDFQMLPDGRMRRPPTG